MKKLLLAIAILITAMAHGQTYRNDTATYGLFENRFKVKNALGIPRKAALTTNTNDTTPQIFINNSNIVYIYSGGVHFPLNAGITPGTVTSVTVNAPLTVTNSTTIPNISADTSTGPTKLTTHYQLTRGTDTFYQAAAFDTTTRILTLTRQSGNTTMLVIPSGGTASGMTAVTNTRAGNIITQTFDNGFIARFSVNDADSATVMHTTDTAAMLAGYNLQRVTNLGATTTKAITTGSHTITGSSGLITLFGDIATPISNANHSLATSNANGVYLLKPTGTDNRVFDIVRDDANGATITGYDADGILIGFRIRGTAQGFIKNRMTIGDSTDNGNMLQVIGTAYVSSVANRTNAGDSILRISGGVITGVTPTQLRSDIGAQASLSVTGENYLSFSSPTLTAGAVNVSGSNITGILKAAAFPALTGDITTTAGGLATTLTTVFTGPGSYGNGASIPTITIDGKGRITAANVVTNTPAAANVTGGASLTKSDDTNVTITLGGTPSASLLAATSITMGWTGTLSGARGGTGVNNGSNTITLGGNVSTANSFTTSGNFGVTQTYTGTTNVTFPTSGTLLTTTGSGASLSGIVTTITGTTNQVNASASTGAVTLSLPQNIHTGATPTFSAITLSAGSGSIIVSGNVTNAAGYNYALGIGNGNGILLSKAGATNTGANSILSIIRDDSNGNTLNLFKTDASTRGIQLAGEGFSYVNGGRFSIGSATDDGANAFQVTGTIKGTSSVTTGATTNTAAGAWKLGVYIGGAPGTTTGVIIINIAGTDYAIPAYVYSPS